MAYNNDFNSKNGVLSGCVPPQTLRWLYIDFNSFFASCEQEHAPHLRGKPLVIVPVMSESTCAIAASIEAKAYGIKTGTPIWEARRKCPSLHLVLASHRRYVEIHEKIIATINAHCLPVAAVCSIDEVACRLEGPEKEEGPARALALHIKAMLRQHVGAFVTCSIGLSSNRLLAKIACDMQKPDGLTLLAPRLLPGPLLSLPLTDIPGIGRNMLARLHRAGLCDMRALWNAPPKELRRAWGSVLGERYWMQLHGYDIPSPETRRSSIGHSRVLDPALRAPEQAWPIVRHLLAKAAMRLREEQYAAGVLLFSARLEKGPRHEDLFRLSPTADTLVLQRALDILWRRLQQRHGPRPLKKIAVVLSDLWAEKDVTPDLFAQQIRTCGHRTLAHAVDSLKNRYGAHVISYGWRGPHVQDFGTKIAFTRVPRLTEFAGDE